MARETEGLHIQNNCACVSNASGRSAVRYIAMYMYIYTYRKVLVLRDFHIIA